MSKTYSQLYIIYAITNCGYHLDEVKYKYQDFPCAKFSKIDPENDVGAKEIPISLETGDYSIYQISDLCDQMGITIGKLDVEYDKAKITIPLIMKQLNLHVSHEK